MRIKILQLKKTSFAVLFILLLCAAGVTNATAQTFTITATANPSNGGSFLMNEIDTDFEDGTFQGWTSIDADGDGHNWILNSNTEWSSLTTGHNGSSDFVMSESYINDVGALSPDNYLVSPPIALGGQITFYACAQDANYAAEHFGVAVSTASNTDPSDFTTIQEWTMTAKGSGAPAKATRSGNRGQGNWYKYIVDLSAYAGQTGYVAIRHFNCSDMWHLNIDDISITRSGGTATYEQGSTCTLRATPAEGYEFVNWKENDAVVSTEATYSFTVAENRNLVAIFVSLEDLCSIVINLYDSYGDGWTGNKLIVNASDDANYSFYEELTFNAGSSATYTLSILDGSHVTLSWIAGNYIGDCSFNMQFASNGYPIYQGTNLNGTSYEFDLNCDDAYTPVAITAVASPAEGGTVSGVGNYLCGEICTLTATPGEGRSFIRWAENGVSVSTDTTYSFTVTGPKNLVAYFSPLASEIITFADSNVEAICVAKWDIDGDGLLSYPEAAAVTNLGTVFRGNTEITSFNELRYFTGLTTIADYAFQGCSNLTSVISALPESVTSIGNWAFNNCSAFTGDLTIPTSITSIGNHAFYNCSNFTGELTIHEAVTYLGGAAFTYCGFTTLNYNAVDCEVDFNGGTVLYNDGGGFVCCFSPFACGEQLTTLHIGDQVQIIPARAFERHTYSNSYVNIVSNSFSGELNIPESVTSIGYNAFYGCYGFVGDLVIPDFVTTIGESAFGECSGFDGTLTIGASVEEIGGSAFDNTHFDELHFNAINCNSIGSTTYFGSYPSLFWGISHLYFGDNVESLPSHVFSECTTFEGEINLPDGLVSIGEQAFRNCNNLTGTLTLPNSLTTIGDQAFYNCYGLEGIVMGNSVETIGTEAFRNCGGIRGELTLPETLLSVGNYAFASCDEISTINYNAIACTEMGNAQSPVFYDCASVEHINIGEHVVSIPNYAFKRCSTVTDMTVAAVVPPTIGSSTFGTVSRSIPVTVPFGSGDDYRNATYWEEFFNIAEGYGANPYINHWHPNTHQFAFNMSVIGIIQINGVEQATNAWEIGAFCGNECRGSKMLAYYSQIDRYVLFLTLYGEQNDLLTLRLYNHENGEESLLVCDEVITFVPNGIMGTYQEPHVFNFLNVQNTSLSQGWNWYSSYVELGAGSLEMMTESMGTSGLLVKSQSGGFVSYDSGEWFGSLSSVNNENTYLINTSANCVMSVIGDFATPAQHPITMVNGWNWIGYPSTSTIDLNTALSRLTPHDGDMIKTQDNFSIYVEGMGWFGDFNTIYPGMGLMYNYLGSQPVTFTYSTGSSKSLSKNRSTLNNHWVTNRQGYPYNMSVMAVVRLDGEELGGDEVELAAFEGNECRGSARLLYVEHLDRYIAFVTVSGAESADLTWKLYYPETGMEYENTEHHFGFEPNGIIGSLDNPYVVDFSTMTATEESFANRLAVYPNPVNANDRVTINMPCASKACVEVVNAIGAKVSVETVTGTSAFVKAPATPGVYVVKVAIDGKGTYTCKLVVE